MSLQLAVDSDTGEWRMPYDESESLYRVRIEKAKSGRAKCRMCGEMIKTGCWRIGVPIKWRTFISVWHHPGCFFLKDGPVNVENGEVYGWELVEDPQDMVDLGKELLKTEPPAHLGGEVNVEDESFLSEAVSAKKLKRDAPKLPAPPEMTVKLLPFQEEGHAWMLDRELNSPEMGGILADEMGLGKTIQTIALIVSGKKRSSKYGGPTLIVAPSSAMLQWQDEIVRCTIEGTLSVLVYQSAKRKKLTPQDILGVDVVLTSYPILENEYRQAINAQKVVCVYCGRKFLARKLAPHHKYFCGPEAQRTARLEKTERSRAESTKKAMLTLKIGANSAPTPTAIYRELMIEAGRTPSSMLTSAEDARAIDSGVAVTPKAASTSTAKTASSQLNSNGSSHKGANGTPKAGTSSSKTSSSSTRGSQSKRSKKVVDSNSDHEEEDVFEDDTPKKKVTFSKDSPKVVEFDNSSSSKPKRSSAVKAQQNLSAIRKAESLRISEEDGNQTDDFDGPRVVWYGKDAGLFWNVGGARWRTVDSEFDQVSNLDDAGKIVIRSRDVLVRLGSKSLDTSLDGGTTWISQVRKATESFWLSSALDDEEEDETLQTAGPYIGSAVVRRFEGKDVVGIVFAYLVATKNGDPPLWRVRHVDGDVEDLEEDELKAALKRAQMTKKLNLSWLRPILNIKRKPSDDVVVLDSSEDGDDSDEIDADDDSFESPESSSSSEEDSVELVDENEEEETVVEEDEDDEEVAYVSTTTTTSTSTGNEGPRFVPQVWGADDAPEEWLSRKERMARQEEKKKRKSKAKKKNVEDDGLKKANGSAAKKNGKREAPSSSSSSESETDDDDNDGELLGDIIYAPAGDVVDDDGVDLNRSLLHCIAWRRIILDEAHKIKDRTNSTAKSVFALRGQPVKEGPAFPSAEVLGYGAEADVPEAPVSQNGKKDPKAPKKPKSAYQSFCDSKRSEIKEANPSFNGRDVLKKLSEMWKDMDSSKKTKFEAMADKDKERYNKEMATYTPPSESSPGEEDEEDEEPKSKKQKRKDDDSTSKVKKKNGANGARKTKSKTDSDESEDGETDKEDERKKSSTKSKAKSKAIVTEENEDEHDHTNSAILFDKCHRWALTGTPLMNRLGDLYSLVRFIRVSPFSFYFCKKGCQCRMLQWSFGWDARFCAHCGHTPMSHYSFFNKAIMNPVNRNGYVGAGRRAMLLLRDELLGNVMLRRTKQERKSDLNLPPLTVETTEIQLTTEERDFYESIYKLSQARFDTFVAKGTVMNNYAHVFQLLSRLRQAADHPYLIVASADSLPSRAAGNSDICRICMLNVDDIGTLAVAKCRHTFHRECVEKYIEDFEEALAAEEDKTGPGAKKKKGGVAKKKKDANNDDDDLEAPKPLPKCPSCHVPLTVTLRVHAGEEEEAKPQEPATSGDNESSCVICFDRPRTALLMPCGHAYMCFECATGLENRSCPVCRTKIEKIVRSEGNGAADGEGSSKKKKNPLFGRKSILQRLKLEEFASSSKLDAIVAEVKKVVESPNRATEKIIVFSQFTTFLDIIQWRLESLKISGVVKLVGSLSVEERRAVLKAFKTDPKVNVILMSLKAGGEGLNLQEATVVLSCDPWWNPSVELQAFHRAHRIGQTRSVRAVRFVTKNTIEERMVELQHKKSLIFEGTVEGNESSLNKLTQEDLRFLFQR